MIWYVIDAGVKLAELYTSLTGSKLKEKRNSSHETIRRAIIDSVLNKFKQDPKMRLDGHCADDFLNCSPKHVLSFIWQVIQRFDQSASGVSMKSWIQTQTVEVELEEELEEDLDRVKSALSEASCPDITDITLRVVTSSGLREVTITKEDQDRPVYEVITDRLKEAGEEIPAGVLLFDDQDVEDATCKQLGIEDAATLEWHISEKSELLYALGFPDEHLSLLEVELWIPYIYIH